MDPKMHQFGLGAYAKMRNVDVHRRRVAFFFFFGKTLWIAAGSGKGYH
jgi:hypothetical protein